MSQFYYYLITVLNLNTTSLLRCALKVDQELINYDVHKYPMEKENLEVLARLLPEHVRSCGPIVDVDMNLLFEVTVVTSSVKNVD